MTNSSSNQSTDISHILSHNHTFCANLKHVQIPPTTASKRWVDERLCWNEHVQKNVDHKVRLDSLRHLSGAICCWGGVWISGALAVPSCQLWWMRTGDSGDERQSQHFPLSAAWSAAPPLTERVSLQSHLGEVLSPCRNRFGVTVSQGKLQNKI